MWAPLAALAQRVNPPLCLLAVDVEANGFRCCFVLFFSLLVLFPSCTRALLLPQRSVRALCLPHPARILLSDQNRFSMCVCGWHTPETISATYFACQLSALLLLKVKGAFLFCLFVGLNFVVSCLALMLMRMKELHISAVSRQTHAPFSCLLCHRFVPKVPFKYSKHTSKRRTQRKAVWIQRH